MDVTQPTWQVGNEQGADCLRWRVTDVKSCILRHVTLATGCAISTTPEVVARPHFPGSEALGGRRTTVPDSGWLLVASFPPTMRWMAAFTAVIASEMNMLCECDAFKRLFRGPGKHMKLVRIRCPAQFGQVSKEVHRTQPASQRYSSATFSSLLRAGAFLPNPSDSASNAECNGAALRLENETTAPRAQSQPSVFGS